MDTVLGCRPATQPTVMINSQVNSDEETEDTQDTSVADMSVITNDDSDEENDVPVATTDNQVLRTQFHA